MKEKLADNEIMNDSEYSLMSLFVHHPLFMEVFFCAEIPRKKVNPIKIWEWGVNELIAVTLSLPEATISNMNCKQYRSCACESY